MGEVGGGLSIKVIRKNLATYAGSIRAYATDLNRIADGINAIRDDLAVLDREKPKKLAIEDAYPRRRRGA